MRIVLILTLLVTLETYAQLPPTFTLRGSVFSARDNTPLPGATIELKHRNIRTTSGNGGAFSLYPAHVNDTVLVSFIGYRTLELPLSNVGSSPLHLELQPFGNTLEEVIVSTGFQKLPKERATGSFTQIDQKKYTEQVGTDVLSRLRTISNGVTTIPATVSGGPASDALIIRGVSTISMRLAKPLIIVDNFPYQGDINNLNPNDVDNITFLKDAAAGSVWGARAANGVIVITTKKGKLNQPTRVEIHSNVSFTPAPDLMKLNHASTADVIDMEQYLFSQNYRFRDTLRVNRPFTPLYELLFARNRSEVSQQEVDRQIAEWRGRDLRRDFADNFYRTAVNQQYALNLSGGSRSLAWTVSAGFDKNIDNLYSTYDRLTARFDNVYRPIDRLELQLAVTYTSSRQQQSRPSWGSIATATGNLAPYLSLYDAAGAPTPIYPAYRKGFIDDFGEGKLLDWRYYPSEEYKYQDTKQKTEDINAQFGLKYNFFPWLSAEVKYRYESQTGLNSTLYDQRGYYARNLINTYSQWNAAGDGLIYNVPKGNIYDQANTTVTAQNLRGQLNVNKNFGFHNLVAMAGWETSETRSQDNGFRAYGYNPDLLTNLPVSYATLYPDIIFGGEGFIPGSLDFNRTNLRFVSFYGNAAYSYSNLYTLSASARRDASNVFGLNTNDKWNPLWSVGAAWNIAGAQFYNLKELPNLKLRVTYGHQGNVDPSMVAVTTLAYYGINSFTLTPYGGVDNFVNPELRWERTAMFNIGLDFGLRGNRLSGSIEYYRKDMTGLYGAGLVDLTAGLGTPYIPKNIGSMKGQGWDVHLRSVNTTGAVEWSSDLIFNTYNDKITKLYERPAFAYDMVGSGRRELEGDPLFGYYAFRWGGLDPQTGDPLGYGKDGLSKEYYTLVYESEPTDLEHVGRILPRFYGSLGNTVSWKSLSLSVRLSYKLGYYFRRPTVNYSAMIGQLVTHSDYARRWQAPGDEQHTDVPSFSYPADADRDFFYGNSAVLATRGDHIRLEYINLSYGLEATWLKKMGFKGLRVYAVASQLGILWKANDYGLDPDYSQLPPVRTISAGINMNF